MDNALRQYAGPGSKGIGVLFQDGVPYLINDAQAACPGHHAGRQGPTCTVMPLGLWITSVGQHTYVDTLYTKVML